MIDRLDLFNLLFFVFGGLVVIIFIILCLILTKLLYEYGRLECEEDSDEGCNIL